MQESTGSQCRVVLLGSFDVIRDDICLRGLPLGAQRLLALLALEDAAVQRRVAGECLWPDSTIKRAAANLRSALWHCNKWTGGGFIECNGSRLSLARGVDADVRLTLVEARRLQDDESDFGTLSSLVGSLSSPLLPDWTDDWLISKRDSWDQFRLRALERLSRRSISIGEYALATEAALSAVAIEPVRETAHRLLMEAYIAEDNCGCAIKHYDRYRRMLERELGVSPSRRMANLVQKLQRI